MYYGLTEIVPLLLTLVLKEVHPIFNTHIVFLCFRTKFFFKHINQATAYPASLAEGSESEIIRIDTSQT